MNVINKMLPFTVLNNIIESGTHATLGIGRINSIMG